MKRIATDGPLVGPPLILIAAEDGESYYEGRLGVGGRWLIAFGNPVALDAHVLICADAIGRKPALSLCQALVDLGYKHCRIARSADRRGTAEYGRRGAWRVTQTYHPDDIAASWRA